MVLDVSQRWQVIEGDCLAVLPTLAAGSVDAVVTDPPYGLEFMGKAWDSFRVDDREVPGWNRRESGAQGGFNTKATVAFKGDVRGTAFGGGKRAQTARCEGCGKRDQFRKPHECPEGTNWRREIVDPYAAPPSMLAFQEWCRAWGIEALRVLKPGGHLLAFGGTRTHHRLIAGLEDAGFEIRDCLSWLYGSGFPKSHNGPWGGTALKPAWEPVVLARKPLIGTVAANHAAHGTGALRIDECRIGTEQTVTLRNGDSGGNVYGRDERVGAFPNPPGRWPANVVLDEAAAERLDAESGNLQSGEPMGVKAGGKANAFGHFNGGIPVTGYGDSGGASRFFYTAKASRSEREAGLRGAEQPGPSESYGMKAVNLTRKDGGPNVVRPVRNTHPTVKPVDLMRWLVRLVTPAGGLVLDPFAGSGTTGVACHGEGLRFVGIEREPAYVEIARARIKAEAAQATLPFVGGAALREGEGSRAE